MQNEKLKIADFRRAIKDLNGSRLDLGGATRDEFRRMKVKDRLEALISPVEQMLLVVPVRFGPDIECAKRAIEHARSTIARWESAQGAALTETARPPLPVPSLRLV